MQRLAEAIIFPAGPADCVGLARVHVTAWRETYAGLLPKAYLDRMSTARLAERWRIELLRPRREEVVLAAENRDGLVGYCSGASVGAASDATGEVFTLYLLREAQRQGLGRRLLASAARVLAAQGAASLELWVLNGNAAAFEFYRRLGGEPAGERAVRGWGGALRETRFRWKAITILCG